MAARLDVYADPANGVVVISDSHEVEYDMLPEDAIGLAGAIVRAARHVHTAADIEQIQEQIDKGLT